VMQKIETPNLDVGIKLIVNLKMLFIFQKYLFKHFTKNRYIFCFFILQIKLPYQHPFYLIFMLFQMKFSKIRTTILGITNIIFT
jgi:hypothetical protein